MSYDFKYNRISVTVYGFIFLLFQIQNKLEQSLKSLDENVLQISNLQAALDETEELKNQTQHEAEKYKETVEELKNELDTVRLLLSVYKRKKISRFT